MTPMTQLFLNMCASCELRRLYDVTENHLLATRSFLVAGETMALFDDGHMASFHLARISDNSI
jgi:hypothetical protein